MRMRWRQRKKAWTQQEISSEGGTGKEVEDINEELLPQEI